MLEYSIVPHEEEEIPLLKYLQEQKFQGYAHPNMPGGTLYKLMLDEETATFLPLKFRLKVFGRSAPEIVIQI
jgi:hypothetical protein